MAENTVNNLKKRKRLLEITLIAVFIIGGIAILTFGGYILYYLTIHGYLLRFLKWIQKIGIWGKVVVVICLIFVNFPFVPAYGLLMMASGFLFHFVQGMIVVTIGCQLGVFAVGVLVRLPCIRERALRISHQLSATMNIKSEKKIEKKYIESKRVLRALMEEVTNNQIKFAILIRIIPFPLGLSNLILSISCKSLLQYQITSFIGLIPEQVPTVYIGSTLNDIALIISGKQKFTWEQGALLGLSMVAVIIFILFVSYIGKRTVANLRASAVILDEAGNGDDIPLIDDDDDVKGEHTSLKNSSPIGSKGDSNDNQDEMNRPLLDDSKSYGSFSVV